MKIVRTSLDLQQWRNTIRSESKIGFVPTMGYLHEGHLSLLREARVRVPSGKVVLSIFVNPSQFGPGEDLSTYPRDLAGDLQKAEAEGVDLVFCPDDPSELYPVVPSTWVQVDRLDRHLCGATRPNHFRGVCTVVAKLWSLIRPDYAIFGEKDIQQLKILQRMHTELFFGGTIIGMPIMRESDGLAMSSRNARLSEESRVEARKISKFLSIVAQRFVEGRRRSKELLADAEKHLLPGRVDYLQVVDAEELQPVEHCNSSVICAIAAVYGGVRLIDNIRLP